MPGADTMTAPAEANVAVATVTTLRAPLEVTLGFVAYHLALGVDRVYLYFDDPDDPAIPLVAGNARVTSFPCGESYWGATPRYVRRDGVVRHWQPGDGPLNINDRQITNANHALGLARAAGTRWLIHLDSDELVHAPDGLGASLAAVPDDIAAVRLAPREGIPRAYALDHPFAAISLFKVPSSRRRCEIARRLGCRILYRGEYFRGHTASKFAVRCAAPVASMEIHGPVHAPGAPGGHLDSRTLALLHYDCQGYDDWCKKWHHRVRLPDDYSGMRGNRLAQFEEFGRAWRAFEARGDDGDLRALYRRMNMPTAYEVLVLRMLGMVETIAFPRERFEHGA